MMTIKHSAMALATVSMIALAAPAAAQDAGAAPASAANGSTDAAAQADQPGSGEILVTAQRRQERVVDVPISITVADQAQLERQHVNTFNDLNQIAPSLEIQSAPGQNAGGGGAIRGIGTQTFSAGAVASVGVVVDQISQGNANITDLFDIARVEVLKGPQGTLFGLTTSAGVINITTNAPDPTATSVRVRTELAAPDFAGSKFGNQVVQGVINLPVTSDSALRVAGSINLRQGVNKNAVTGDWNNINNYSVRARYLYQPAGPLTVNLIGDYAKGTQTGSGDFFTFIRANGPTAAPPFAPPFFADPVGNQARLLSCGVVAKPGNQKFCIAQDIHSHTENWGLSGELDYDFGPATLTSITAYRSSSNANNGGNIFRADPVLTEITSGPATGDIDLFTQEIRLSSASNARLEYTVGGFLSRQKSDGDAGFFKVVFTPDPSLAPFPGFSIPFVDNEGVTNTHVTDHSEAAFGQATFHATDALRLIAGVRYTHSALGLDTSNATTGTSTTGHFGTDKVSYKGGIQYDISSHTMGYVTVARGFKGGQITIPTNPGDPARFLLPEIPMDYEAGLKSTLFGSWIMDLNVFYEKIGNYQAQQCLSDPVTLALSCSQTNIDGVKSRGGEINFFGHISQQLTLNTGFIYTKVTYPDGFLGTDGTDIGGTQLAYSPRYKFTLSGEYEVPLTSSWNGFLDLDTVWKSRLRYEANSIRDTTFGPHWTVGGRLGVRSEDNRYTAGLFVRNLFNVHEPSLEQSGFPDAGAANIGAIYGPQSFREVGLTLDAQF